MTEEPSPESEAAVTAEFHTFLNDAAGLYGVTTTALPFLRGQADQFARIAGIGADHPMFFTVTDMPQERPSDAFAVWPRSLLASRLAPEGVAARQAGHQWVVHVFSMWEHGYRPRLAAARGVDTDDVKIPVLGDLRLIRNDVVHHRGIATADSSGKCQQLRWFSVGEDMLVTGRMIYQFMDAFGLGHPAPPPR